MMWYSVAVAIATNRLLDPVVAISLCEKGEIDPASMSSFLPPRLPILSDKLPQAPAINKNGPSWTGSAGLTATAPSTAATSARSGLLPSSTRVRGCSHHQTLHHHREPDPGLRVSIGQRTRTLSSYFHRTSQGTHPKSDSAAQRPVSTMTEKWLHQRVAFLAFHLAPGCWCDADSIVSTGFAGLSQLYQPWQPVLHLSALLQFYDPSWRCHEEWASSYWPLHQDYRKLFGTLSGTESSVLSCKKAFSAPS